jgi:diguanylate cyclase (GGDEF)-like protein
MRLSQRYMWFGALIGLSAPSALFLFAITTNRNPDLYWLSIVLAVGGAIVFALLGRMIGTRDEALEELSDTDALTGLSNRRSFDRRLDLELSRTWRYGVKNALVMIDLDHFKILNDRFGHRAGDEVLRRVAAILDSEKRAGDLVVRYGGEEFAAILSDTTISEAINWAERARQRIAACRITWEASNLTVTASFGIAGAASWAVTKEQLIESADQMLYAAKGRGRNTVVSAPDPAKERPGAGPQHPRLHAA